MESRRFQRNGRYTIVSRHSETCDAVPASIRDSMTSAIASVQNVDSRFAAQHAVHYVRVEILVRQEADSHIRLEPGGLLKFALAFDDIVLQLVSDCAIHLR